MSVPDRILSWNAKVGRRPAHVVRAVRRFIRRRNPDVIVLIEAGGYVEELRATFHGDWHAYRHHSDVVVMVRKGIAKPEITVLEHDVKWRGPHAGIAHTGRKWLRLDWPNLRLVAVHRVPGGPSGGVKTKGANRPAWEAEDFLLAGAVSTDKPLLIVGDQNARIVEMRDFMARHDLRAIPTGAKVDWAMARGINGRGQRLGRGGSDHRAVLYVLR